MCDTNITTEQGQPFDQQLFGMTTIVECVLKSGQKSQGSGFFYNVLAPKDETIKGAQWRRIDGLWLVTNRHVVLPKINDKECIPEYFVFNLREVVGQKVEWLPVSLSQDKLLKRLKLHSNSLVDIAVIDISDLVTEQIKDMSEQKRVIITPSLLSNDNLPSVSQMIVDVTSDIVVASYPRGYYDRVNKFPIVKSGIVSSAWKLNFNGLPLFLIDAKLFPGSSGGLVISKPKNIDLINGKIAYSQIKQFVLLGVYSGEPVYKVRPIELDGLTIIREESYGLGNVCYAELIPDIISNGENM